MNDSRPPSFPARHRVHGLAAALLMCGALASLSGCGGDAQEYQPQQWQGKVVTLESRPNPPTDGMNEILVTITDKHGRPDSRIIVSLRADDRQPWTQAIQDGQMGVFRRAVRIDPATDKAIEVQIESGDTANVLSFPLGKTQR